MKTVRMCLSWVGLIAVAACAGTQSGDEDSGTTVSVAEGTVVPESTGAAIDTVNPYESMWNVATLQGHLRRAGVATTEAGEVRQAFMGPRGVRLRGEEGEVQVYIYADAGARARDTEGLDSSALALPLAAGNPPRHASLVTANNLAVIVIGADSTLHRSVASVLRSRRD